MASIVGGESTQVGSPLHNVATATPTAGDSPAISIAHGINLASPTEESTQGVATPTAGDSQVVINVTQGVATPTAGDSQVVINVTQGVATPTAGDSQVVINVTQGVATPTAGDSQVVINVTQGVDYWDRKISEVKGDYNNHGDYIYKTFTISVGFLAVIVTAMFYCARQIKETVGCDGWWNRLIHSAQVLLTMVSSTTIAIVVFEFVQQFKLLKLERQYQRKRGLEPNNCAGSRQWFYWWLLRCAFILIFFVFSAYIFATWTHLRCP